MNFQIKFTFDSWLYLQDSENRKSGRILIKNQSKQVIKSDFRTILVLQIGYLFQKFSASNTVCRPSKTGNFQPLFSNSHQLYVLENLKQINI